MTPTTPAPEPVRLAVPGRTLVLVAGMPGAGKTTLLRGLAVGPELVVLDSDSYRAALRGAFGGSVPYAAYRPLVHLWHRIAVLVAAVSAVPTVVVHLPATDPGTREAVVRLADLTGRAAHLLWLHVDAGDARRGQRERGRIVPDRSFAGHAERAAATTAGLRAGRGAAGWSSVTVLDRAAASAGLCLVTGAGLPVERARARHK